MSQRHFARVLGQKGGRARAARLSAQERKAIASRGGAARAESFRIARRIRDNFRYLDAIRALRKPPQVRSLKTASQKLPGIYV